MDETKPQIEQAFMSLPGTERTAIISLGVTHSALRYAVNYDTCHCEACALCRLKQSPRRQQVKGIVSLAALRLSYLKKRLFLAENKLQQFESRYGVSLAELDAQGLPDDADHVMHEDYLMWHHWAGVVDKLKPNLAALEEIVQQGLSAGQLTHAGG